MRVFWIIMTVLAVAAALLWFLRPPPKSPAPAPGAADGLTVPDLTAAEAAAAAAKRAAAPVAEPVKSTPKVEASVPVVNEKPVVPVAVAAKPAEKPAAAVHEDEHDAIGPVTEHVLVPEPVVMRDPFTIIPVKGGTSAKPRETAAKPDAQAAAPAAASLKLEPQDDGSTLVDGKYVIKGEGTKANPYRVTWEMLLTSEETYRPRLGKKVIPERVKMLDGKWIKISGYIAFPIMATSGDEMLMMLNQWDGCCIGVPPTPYDAIEVKLKTAAKGNDRLRTSGTLTGKFRVDPYLVKDWLISLYVMDDGELSDLKGEAQAPGVHAGNGP